MRQIFLKLILAILCICAIAKAVVPEWINVKEYGAVGDGITDDTIAIQSAIQSSTNKRTVFFPVGVYKVGLLQLSSNLTIKSDNAVLKCQDNINSNWITAVNCHDIDISGLKIDGNSENNIVITVADILTIYNADNIKIHKCVFANAADSALMLSCSRDCIIYDNIFDNGRDVGIYVNNDWTRRDNNSTTALRDCLINGNRISGFVHGGIALKRVSRRITVSNNIISHCGNGITCEHASYEYDFSKEILIYRNTIEHIGNWADQRWYPTNEPPAGRGINLRVSDYSIVNANTVKDCYSFSIIIEGSAYCSIADNIIEGSDNDKSGEYQTGIYLINRSYNDQYGNPVNVKTIYNCIEGNIIKNHSDYGIYEYSGMGGYNVFISNILEKNRIDKLIGSSSYNNQLNKENPKEFLPADIDKNGSVDLSDLFSFLDKWLE